MNARQDGTAGIKYGVGLFSKHPRRWMIAPTGELAGLSARFSPNLRPVSPAADDLRVEHIMPNFGLCSAYTFSLQVYFFSPTIDCNRANRRELAVCDANGLPASRIRIMHRKKLVPLLERASIWQQTVSRTLEPAAPVSRRGPAVASGRLHTRARQRSP
jgi:hypothetical protein